MNETSSIKVPFYPRDRYSCSLKGYEKFPSPSVYVPQLPSVSVSPSGEIVEGSSVTLTCSSDANPAASYSWYKKDLNPQSGIQWKHVSKDQHLIFSSIKLSDSGQYLCRAENKLGSNGALFKLSDMKYVPQLPSVSVSPSGEIVEGSLVNLTCSSDANPAASYFWYKEDEESPKVSGQIFIITDVRPEHSGNYFCEAQNSRGSQRSTVYLTVVRDPLLKMTNTIRLTLVVLMPIPLLVLCLRTRSVWFSGLQLQNQEQDVNFSETTF